VGVSTAAVFAEGVTVRDGERLRLDSVGLTVNGGEIHAVVGPNGSGKSTLLHVLAGEISPDEGRVLVMGNEYRDLNARTAARRRALLAQETAMLFSFTVDDVVRWGRLPWRGTDQQADDDAIAADVLADNELSHLADRRVSELSGGERARVHLARVLAQRAPILLLDEADATLDLAGQAHLDDILLRRRDAGDAIVVVGHDLGRLSAIADTATLLSHGRVVSQGMASDTLTAANLSKAYGVKVAEQPSNVYNDGPNDGRRTFWVPGVSRTTE
jgi:iron complex transport system ATP-binding protein